MSLPVLQPSRVTVMIKPVGALYNLDCTYCYYLPTTAIYDGIEERMSLRTLENLFASLLSRFHDHCRISNRKQPIADKVLASMKLLQQHGLEHNIQCVINDYNDEHPDEVLGYLPNLGQRWWQFIPAIEWETDAANPVWNKLEPYSPQPEPFVGFLCCTFDLWFKKYRASLSVLDFDAVLHKLVPKPTMLCNSCKMFYSHAMPRMQWLADFLRVGQPPPPPAPPQRVGMQTAAESLTGSWSLATLTEIMTGEAVETEPGSKAAVGPNDPCPFGSGLKHKKMSREKLMNKPSDCC